MAVQWSESRFQELFYVPDIIEDTAAPSVPTEEAGLIISELQPFGAQLEWVNLPCKMLGLTLALILLKPYSVRVKIPAGMADMIVVFQSGLT